MIVDFFTDNLYDFNITAKMGVRPVTSVLFHPKLLSRATLEKTKLNHLLRKLFSRPQIFMFIQKYMLSLQKIERLKSNSRNKEKIKENLETFKLLGSISGSQIDIPWINIIQITVEFNKWFKNFIWTDIYSLIAEHELLPAWKMWFGSL